ncbi:MAG: hypothetical protein DMG71_08625 [Acidobacteria bacterium]|nr:MAG: hypothetical protein DMG71_08625 [Acidobacteriota bacterium]
MNPIAVVMQPHAEEAEEENPDLLRYEALLEMADLMVHHGTTAGLLHELAARLHSVAVFEVATVSLHDASSDVMYVQTWEGGEPLSVPFEVGVEESASGWVWRHQEPLLLSDLRKETRFASILDKLRARGIRTYCMLPLTTSQNRLGALGFGRYGVSPAGGRTRSPCAGECDNARGAGGGKTAAAHPGGSEPHAGFQPGFEQTPDLDRQQRKPCRAARVCRCSPL